MNEIRSVRLSQTISPFGVGAIYDVLGESFVACDTTLWRARGERIVLNRLARALSVEHFRLAPVKPDFGSGGSASGIPYMRFPEWLFCSRCRNMQRADIQRAHETPTCRFCSVRSRLVAMRFVQICDRGHLGDVDWWWWAHSGSQGQRCEHRKESLKFKVNPEAGGGLASLVIEAACGARRSLDRLTGKDALKRVGISCTGHQPWQRGRGVCESVPQVVQRGASNLHYSRIVSAIDIPPESNAGHRRSAAEQIKDHPHFSRALNAMTSDGRIGKVAPVVVEIVAEDVGVDKDDVIEVLLSEWSSQRGFAAQSGAEGPPENLDAGEYLAFTVPREGQCDDDNFITHHVSRPSASDGVPERLADELERVLSNVVLVPRLREVRALTGFTRLQPGGDEVELVSPSLGARLNWLPAIEVMGEGIFIAFREQHLADWESDPRVVGRASVTDEAVARSGYEWLPRATPRFIALHTLAHLLIRRLTFDCGYSSASLREKIYSSTPMDGAAMSGILIYTASGDTEGSLGGLTRQGEPTRLARTIAAALAAGAWCSSDPVCSELRSGPAGLNSGACHACSLVAETSCFCSNLLLDRTLLLGGSDVPGLLQDLADTVVKVAAQGVSPI